MSVTYLNQRSAAVKFPIRKIFRRNISENNGILSDRYTFRNPGLLSYRYKSITVDIWICLILSFISGSQADISANDRIFGDDRFFYITAIFYLCAIHDYRIANDCPFTDRDTTSYNRIYNGSIDICSFTYNTSLNMTIGRCICRWKAYAPCVYLPVILIKIELRNKIDKFHICFPIRIKRPYILPVSAKFISIKCRTGIMTIRDYMLAKIKS